MKFPSTFSLLPFFLLFVSPVCSLCPITTCSNNTAAPIRFPFRLAEEQPENCSYPGFDLHCTEHGFPAISMPHAGEFLVRYISYQTQNIRIYDPKSCLPRRILDGFDPSGSPFQANFYVNYTFLSCPRNVTDEKYTVIECLSNETRSVIATAHPNLALNLGNHTCQKIKTLPLPVAWPQNDEFTSSLSDDIWLSWDLPDCKDCEVRGGVCGFQNKGSHQIGCFNDPLGSGAEQEGGSKGLKVFRIIAFSIAVPAILCAMFVGIFLFLMERRDGPVTWAQQMAVTPQPQEPSSGLDQATIDSYTKVVLGESRRVPGLNDGSCAVCLSDFGAKDTVRCIPGCQHCFHVDCIDEWLKMNSTCPLCRTSPAHHIQFEDSTE